MSSEHKPRVISVDFDRTLHSHVSGRLDTVVDPPVDGAIEFLDMLARSGYLIAIHTARISSDSEQRTWPRDIKKWLYRYGALPQTIAAIERISDRKHHQAVLFIDDRAFRFEGRWPDKNEIDRLSVSWNEKKRVK